MPTYQDAIARRVEKIVRMLVQKEYDALSKASNGVRVSADQIHEAITAYNGHIVMPPDVTYDLCDVVEVENSEPKRWSVDFDLWTEEEGRSDLTLELTLIDNGSGDVDFEIDGIHVL